MGRDAWPDAVGWAAVGLDAWPYAVGDITMGRANARWRRQEGQSLGRHALSHARVWRYAVSDAGCGQALAVG